MTVKLADMKNDEEFHLALSVKSWYENHDYPLSFEEQRYRKDHSKRHVYEEASKYVVPYKRARQIKMMVLSEQWPHNRVKNSHLTKADCELIAKYRHEGMWWDEIQRVTHHSTQFIKKMSRQYGVKI